MKKIVVSLLILLAAFCWANNPPEVSNIEAVQRVDGSKIVDITYDLYDADGDDMTVSVQVSDDGGSTWNVNCATLSGDVGDGVYSGNGKQIVWDFGADNPGEFGDNYKVKVNIDDHYEVVPAVMIFVEGGSFEMGDHFNEGNTNELPVHTVTVNSFYIGQYEVTQGEYEAIMGNNPSYYTGSGDNAPVECVSWYDAVEYCNALSIQEGLTPCYDTSDWSCNFGANGYRLPTEAEWEYSSRGGINWEDNYRYSGTTDNLGDYALYYSNSGFQTHEVGNKLPNQLDIYDMGGNVWEWCNDRYSSSYYGSSPEDNPTGPDSGSSRVGRGGSWANNANCCRVAFRYNLVPGNSYSHVGFRILRAYSY